MSSTKLLTGIWELDKLLLGGVQLPFTRDGEDSHGLVVLVKGEPGVGKSTLALQLTAGLASSLKKLHKEDLLNQSCYFSLEQEAEDLNVKLSLMNAHALAKVTDRITDAGDIKRDVTNIILNIAEFNHNAFKKNYRRIRAMLPSSNISKYLGLEIERIKSYVESLGFLKDIYSDHYKKETKKLRRDIAKKKWMYEKDKSEKLKYNVLKEICDSAEAVYKLISGDRINKHLDNNKPKNFEDLENIWRSICRHKKMRTSPLKLPQGGNKKKISATYNDPNKKAMNIISNLVGNNVIFPQSQDEINVDRPYDKNYDPLSRTIDIIEYLQGDLKKHSNANQQTNKYSYPVVTLDGLNILAKDDRDRLNLNKLIDDLRNMSRIGIIVYEPHEGEFGFPDYAVDMILDLRTVNISSSVNSFVSQIAITKSRYQKAAESYHQYKLTSWGIDIYPSIGNQVRSNERDDLYRQLEESKSSMKKTETESRDFLHGKGKAKPGRITSIVERILGGFKQGSSLVIFGPRRTIKSLLCLDFLCAGSRHKKTQKGLLVSVMDNQDTITMERTCNRVCPKSNNWSNYGSTIENLRYKSQCDNCFDHISLFHLRQESITTAEFYHFLRQRLDLNHDNPIKRLAFWDLTQLEYKFPLLAEDPMFLPAFFDFLRFYRVPTPVEDKPASISSVIMSAANAKLAGAASAMADNVIFCWRDRFRDKKNKSVMPTAYKYIDPNEYEEVMMLYVDRAEGNIVSGSRPLYALPIIKNKYLSETPKDAPEAYLKDKYIIKNYSCDIHKFLFTARPEEALEKAGPEIEAIIQMQGIGYGRAYSDTIGSNKKLNNVKVGCIT